MKFEPILKNFFVKYFITKFVITKKEKINKLRKINIMVTKQKGVMVLKEFLTEKLGREVSIDEAYACMNALEKAYNEKQFEIVDGKLKMNV